MQKTILVLGATGHLGANCAVHLKANGYNVIAVGHRVSDNGFFATKQIRYIGGFSLEDSDSYHKLPHDIDAVVHLAGTMPAHADNSPMPYVQSIIVGMVRLCEWLTETHCKRIIFNTTPSDVSAFFDSGLPVPEDAPRSFPKNGGDHGVYAIAKNCATDILEHYKYAKGISSCVFRHLTVYGYNPNPYYSLDGVKKILPWRKILLQAQNNQPVEIWGDKDRKKELLYVKDFVEAIRLALESNVEGIVNLPGDRPYTLEEQITTLVEVFNSEESVPKISFAPDKPDTPQNLLLIGKAKTELNWQPKFNWKYACLDMKQAMKEEPFRLLWGRGEDFITQLI